jgi:hypothetical protein
MTADVPATLPKPTHLGCEKALVGIWGAWAKDHALVALRAFETAYGAMFP